MSETKDKDKAIEDLAKEDDLVSIRIVLNEQQSDSQFVSLFERLSRRVHKNSVKHGFWEKDAPGTTDGEKIALMHSELSEALEGIREGNPPDDKISEFSSAEAELADVVIRIMDFATQKGFRLPEAILAKSKFNESRPYKHGKSF